MSIVVAVDLSAATNLVTTTAANLSRSLDAELILVHVAPPQPDFVTYEVGPKHERDWRASALHDEHSALDAIAAELRQDGIRARARMMEGDPVEKILSEADKVDAQIIILGSHGHDVAYEVLVGSVTEALIKRSHRPVLVIPVNKTQSLRSD